MKMDIPSPVLHSLFALNTAGYEAYVVGGCVRDCLLGETPTDWDITTSALPEQTRAVFSGYRTLDTGIKHGTITVLIEGMSLEITTFRVDGNYSDGRHPDVVSFTPSLTEDLRRRDFTINAMAYHPECGLIDPFGGRRDLKNRVIRCVGKPKTRFTEDALRILRGLRFASTLGFSIRPATSRAMHRLAHTLSCISAERISVEFLKLLCGKTAKRILSEYADVLSVFLPDVDFKRSAKRVEYTPVAPPLRHLAALMLNLSPEQAEESCRRLRLSSHLTEETIALVRYQNLDLEPTRSSILHTLHLLGPKLLSELLYLRTATDQKDYDSFRIMWEQLEFDNDCCHQLKDLAVTGDDLIKAGLSAGPEIGITLNRLLNAVMDGNCTNDKDSLLKLALKKPVQ